MNHLDQPLARRAVITGAGLGLAAGVVGGLSAAQAADAERSEGGEIWSSEYWARKGDVPLWMFAAARRAQTRRSRAACIIFCSRFVGHFTGIRPQRPGHGEYSVMNEFARHGFDCWTMDHENYGKSGRTSGNSTSPAASRT